MVSFYTAIAALQWFAINKQADSAERSNKLLETQLLPYIVVKQIDFRDPIVADKPTSLRADFINEGGTPAFEIRPQINIDQKVDGTKPDYIFHDGTGSTGTVGAKEPFDVPGAMRATPQEGIEQINNGTRIVYVSGNISYSDFSHKRHHTYFCVQYQPSSGKMVGCRDQRESD
jgi:hypothetical protein